MLPQFFIEKLYNKFMINKYRKNKQIKKIIIYLIII